MSLATDIYLTEIEGLHQKDNKGAYDLLLNEALKGIKGPVNIKLLDPGSSTVNFTSCENCCISPANNNANFYNWSGKIEELAAFNYAKVYAFSKQGAELITSLEQLKGKKVGGRTGMPYGNKVEGAGLNLIGADTIEENIRKTESGELDAFVAFVPDAYMAYKAAGVTNIPYSKKSALSIHIDRMICRNAPRVFIDKYNANMKTMRDRGFIRRKLGDQFVKPF